MSGTSKRRSPASLLVIVESLLGVVPWEVPTGVNACDDSQAAIFFVGPKMVGCFDVMPIGSTYVIFTYI